MVRKFLSILLILSAYTLLSQINPDRIEIIRDKWGVPHIYAPTDAEVAYGLAWAHCEDDFETIQLPLISAKQMLGRHLGKNGAAVDYVVELLRLKEAAEQYNQQVSPEFRKIVRAYVEAVNAFATKHPKRVLVKKAFPVTELDVYKAYGLSLSVISGADQVIKNLFDGNVETDHLEGYGSNAIAVSRGRTNDGSVYLAVNSHQPLEGPVAWYEAHLKSDEGWNMMGGLFPGAPIVLHGTNEYLGWAHTVNYPDKIDTYKLRVDPTSSDRYMLDGEWKELEAHKVKLTVKLWLGLKLSVKREVLYSAFGPVVRNEKGTFAFNLSTLTDIGALEQWYRLNKTTDLASFQEALGKLSNPGFNIVYADREDNIYHVGYAKIPHRDPSLDWFRVVVGDQSKHIHKTYHPLEDLPSNLNPSSGFVFNTNNSAFSSSSTGHNPNPADYDKTMGYGVWENNRSIRMLDLFETHKLLGYEAFKAIKYDLTLPDSLVYPLDINPLWHWSEERLSPKAQEVRSLIASWDKVATTESIGSAQAIKAYEFLQQEAQVPYRGYCRPSAQEFDVALEKTYNYFMKYFGRVDVKLGEFQFLVRGERALPLQGVDDVIAAIRSAPYENGRVKAVQGESYIMMIRYPKEGLPIVETVNVFGASNVEGSDHYDDQMQLFVDQKLKLMSLDIDEVRESAKAIYRPK